MKSIPKLIRRFVLILLLSIFLFLVLNIGFLIFYTVRHSTSGGPWTAAQEAASAGLISAALISAIFLAIYSEISSAAVPAGEAAREMLR